MATKLYFLDDTSSHQLTWGDYQEICDLPLGFEPEPYLVIATVDFDRENDEPSYAKTILCEVRLDVLSGLGAPIGSEYQQFELSTVVDSVNFERYDRTPSCRHASLMVTATVPAEGGGGRDTSLPFSLGETETSGAALLVPPPRAILSARGSGPAMVVLSNVRIVAFQADEVVVKHL